ncbi:MAG: IS110 family transposase [Deltaproteobacteria bacterium]|nr:IS110 family transposase [Deltaproteobacteria bacterium]
MAEAITGTTLGVDLGDKQSELCMLDTSGAVVRRAKVATKPAALEAEFGRLKATRVVIEVGTHSGWVVEVLRKAGHEVIVANPRQVKLISEGRRKTDRHDAELLARLGRSDVSLLSPVTPRALGDREALALIRSRDQLVKLRTSLVNHVRGAMKAFGFRLPSKIDAAAMHRHRGEIPVSLQPALWPLFDQLQALAQSIAALDESIEAEAAKRPDVALLTPIRGVGTLTALAFVLVVGDASRFRRSRTVGAYLGLCSGKRQSGDKDPELSISKCGDPLLRRLLVNCANYILGPFGGESDLRTWGLKLAAQGESKRARARAKVAVARKLAVLMHSILKNGTAYEPVGFGKKKELSAAV